MSLKINHLIAAGLLLFFISSLSFAEPGRIYGKIYTDRGDVLEGPIRWDYNEAFWDDMLDGYKEQSRKAKKEKRRKYGDDGTEINIFGLTIFKDGGSWSSSRQACIAFGHIKKLTPESDDGALMLLKGGEEVFIESSSTDLGTGIREIVIEEINEGELELDWYDIDYIEFFDGGDVESDFGERIFGTVTTRKAGEFTGWICWDVDEMFTKDIIDGRDRSRKRKIKFAKIARIEKISSQASLIVLKDGKEIRLDDSNDVDSGNRGIVVSDGKMGRVVIEWDEFEALDIKEPEKTDYVAYEDFDGGRRLYGTIYDEDGESYSGNIRWDNDEAYTWEILDGNYRGIEFDIAFEHIKSIEKLSRRSSRVTLWDGRKFKLRDSNDVNDENNGIFVAISSDPDDEEVMEWDDFDRIEFKAR
jgi:hypothetical protein